MGEEFSEKWDEEGGSERMVGELLMGGEEEEMREELEVEEMEGTHWVGERGSTMRLTGDDGWTKFSLRMSSFPLEIEDKEREFSVEDEGFCM